MHWLSHLSSLSKLDSQPKLNPQPPSIINTLPSTLYPVVPLTSAVHGDAPETNAMGEALRGGLWAVVIAGARSGDIVGEPPQVPKMRGFAVDAVNTST